MRRIALQRWMQRRGVRRALVVLACVLALIISYGLGASEEPGSEVGAVSGRTAADLAEADADREAGIRERYAAGVAEGRAAFAPGTPAYRRIRANGVRAGRKAMTPKLKARYAAGVKAGKAAAGKSYDSGHDAGYDKGYDDGWDVGYDEGLDDGADDPSFSPDAGAEDSPDIGYDLDCADFAGPVSVSPGDPHGLDADGDGVGCE